MDTDALKAGRPIHQSIATTGEIDSAFDGITEKFREPALLQPRG
jgi:hypothetical protein